MAQHPPAGLATLVRQRINNASATEGLRPTEWRDGEFGGPAQELSSTLMNNVRSLGVGHAFRVNDGDIAARHEAVWQDKLHDWPDNGRWVLILDGTKPRASGKISHPIMPDNGRLVLILDE
jgi:hypothetical protein